MYAKLLLLFGLMRSIVASCDFILDGSELLSEYQISSGVFKNLITAGLTSCQIACLHRTKCVSLSYNRETLQCFMGKYTDSKVSTGNRNDVFMKLDWNRKLPETLGPCRYRQCSLVELCVPLWSGNHACVTEMKSVDLTVLIDTSFNTVQSGFQFIIDSVQLVLGHLYDVRLAVAHFGDRIHEVKFKLDQYIDEEDQLNALQNLSYSLKHGSRLAEGVQAVHTTVYNGSAGDRPGVQDVILIMLYTDDIAQQGLEDSVAEAKADGIHIIAVGIRTRSNYGHKILNMIVSEPLEDNQLIATSYEAFLDMDKEIAEVIKRSIS